MADKQATIQTIMELARKNYNPVGEPDEFGIELMAKDQSHTLKITHSGVNFTSTVDATKFYAYGFTHLAEIRKLLNRAPAFDETVDQPRSQPRSQAGIQVTKTSGPSVRGTVLSMLDQHAALPPSDLQEQILAVLVKQHPERDPKKLKAQIYLHRSEWNRKQVKP